MDMMNQGGANVCKCPHHKMLPALVVLFGLLFLGGTLGWWSMQMVNVGWPILVIVGGLFKMTKTMCKCC